MGNFMSELVFESSLSLDEIESNFADIDLFTELMGGLGEALTISKRIETADTFDLARN